MAWFKRLSRFRSRTRMLATILIVALTIGLIVNLPAQVQAQLSPGLLISKLPDQIPDQWEFRAPRGPDGSGGPVNTASGGTRNPDSAYGCQGVKGVPVSLVPATSLTGATIAAYPTFFWYMPQTSAAAAEFVLWETSDRDVYRAEYTLAKPGGGGSNPGVMSLSLPAYANLPPLNIGKKYHWTLALVCDPLDHSGDVLTEGWIERVQPDPTLASRIQQATPQERVALYADQRLWYDAVATLDELRRDGSNSIDSTAAWNKLLKSAGLDVVAQK